MAVKPDDVVRLQPEEIKLLMIALENQRKMFERAGRAETDDAVRKIREAQALSCSALSARVSNGSLAF